MAKPDFDNLKKALLRQGPCATVPCWELFADREIMSLVIGEQFPAPDSQKNKELYARQLLAYQLKMGYDFLMIPVRIPAQTATAVFAEDTAENSRGQRAWLEEHNCLIRNWEDFERYRWPDASEIDYSMLEYGARILPEGMKLMVNTTGVLENVQWLMGYETLALALFDEPDLVGALFEKVGALLHSIYRTAAQMRDVALFAMGDDLGFKSATLFAPDMLRQHVFPWQKKCAAAAHSNGGIFILHSCGNLQAVMDDLIDDVRIDAKHSYEDVILPVEEAYARYGGRVAIVGGVDMDLLCRGSEADVRARVRHILELCAPGGGYVMGTGNSVANYIPLRNFLAMMDETRKFH
jgi:uroporphyrinogen decarboxylase